MARKSIQFIKPSQLDQSKPGTWPIYYKIITWLLLIGLVYFFYNKFVYEDIAAEQERISSSIAQLEGEYKDLYQISLDLPQYEQQKKDLTKKLIDLLDFLPAQTEMPSLIDGIYDAAYKSGVNFTELTPEASIVEEFYNVEPISLETTTGFNNFASFVQYIEKMSRILNVRQFDFEIEQDAEDDLVITSKLETYIYNQDISELVDLSEGDTK